MSILVNISPEGRINLPSSLRKKMGLSAGGTVLVDETDNGLVLRTVSQSVAKAQALAREYTGQSPTSSVDAFLANRRQDSGE